MPLTVMDVHEQLQQAVSPEERAALAMRILMEGRYDDFKPEFKEYLYPGQDNGWKVFDLILEETAKNSKLADEILKLGKRGDPFRRTHAMNHQEGFIYAACLDALKDEYKPEELIARFVDVVYNSDDRFPRRAEECQKISAAIQSRMKENQWTLLEMANDAVASCNQYTIALKLPPVLSDLSDYFLHAKKQSAEFSDKKSHLHTLTLQKGVDNLYIVNKIMKTKGKSRVQSSDYYHQDRLVASVDNQSQIITLYDKKPDNIFSYFEDSKWSSYRIRHTDALIEYPGFAKLCKDFAKEKKLTPVVKVSV